MKTTYYNLEAFRGGKWVPFAQALTLDLAEEHKKQIQFRNPTIKFRITKEVEQDKGSKIGRKTDRTTDKGLPD